MVSLFFLVLFSISRLKAQSDTVFANGADIGWLSQMEASGYKFYNDSNIEKDCMDILKEKGINSLRFRVWVNPTDGWCGKKDVATMAIRAKNKGFRIMIDFHYSDTWADPGKQGKPAAWKNDAISKLDTDVYNHTYEVLDTLKSIGVIPEWVQIGNETSNGMLWPDGMASSSMKNFASLVTSGYNAIKAVDSSILAIVHLADGNKNSTYRWMFDGLKSNNAKWDVIGMSLYPYWANLPWTTADNECLSNMQDMISRYHKKVMIVETGYLYNQARDANNFLLDLIEKTKSVGGLGVFYWEPECYNWQSYNLGAWDPTTKKPTSALDAFLGIKDTTGASAINATNQNEQVSIYPNPANGKTLQIKLPEYSGSTQIKIFNLNGNVLMEQYFSAAKTDISIENTNLLPGSYFIQIKNMRTQIVRSFIVE